MNKMLLLTGLSLSSVIHVGCTTLLLNETFSNESKTVTGILLEDTLIAIGVPSKPVKGYEDALAIAGDKYSYLVQSSHSNKEDELPLKRILQEVDLKYLKVGQVQYKPFDSNDDLSTKYQDIPDDNTIAYVKPEFNIKIYESKKTFNHRIEGNPIAFTYFKDNILIKPNEISELKSLGFICESSDKFTRCINRGNIDITVAKSVTNKDKLVHLLKQPLHLKVEYEVTKNSYKGFIKYPLMPLAIAFDIVTSPLQLVGYLGLASAYGNAGI